MATWKKVMLGVLVGLFGAFPVFSCISYAQEIASVFPAGEMLSDEELQKVEGEVWWWLVGWIVRLFLVGAIAGWITYHQTGDVLFAAEAGIGAMTIAILCLR